MKTRRKFSGYVGFDTRIDWHSPELATLVAARALPAGRVLDLGCGHGTESLFLAAMGWKVLGIDLDEDGTALRLARERGRKMPKKVQADLRFMKGDALRFREKVPGTFDVVIERLLIVNLRGKNILRALRSAAYALREGGAFVLRIGISAHPVPIQFDLLDSLSEGDDDPIPGAVGDFLAKHFENFRSKMVGYRGLVTPCQDSGFLVAGSHAMGIMILMRNGKRLT